MNHPTSFPFSLFLLSTPPFETSPPSNLLMNHHRPFAVNDIDRILIMKRSPSELALEALCNENNNNNNNNNNSSAQGVTRVSGNPELIFESDYQHQVGPTFVGAAAFPAVDGISFGFKHDHYQEIMDGFGGLTGDWYQNIVAHQQPCVSATIESQSSICGGSPTSTLKPKVGGDNQGSGSSEDDEVEIEEGTGLSELSNDPLDHDPKRIRRMLSNKESARRSRMRKQAERQELETQVEVLTGENVTLFKQLGDAAQQLRDASTNNRVLKSDVEALRAKVKLAEDRVTRGTMSPSLLNHILQTQLGSLPPQMLSPQTLSRVGSTIGIRGSDDMSFGGLFSGIVGNNNVVGSTITHDAMSSCVSQMWPN